MKQFEIFSTVCKASGGFLSNYKNAFLFLSLHVIFYVQAVMHDITKYSTVNKS